MKKIVISILLGILVICGTTKRADAVTFSIGDYYYLQSALNSDMVLDVSGGSKKNGANIQLWKKNGTDAQLFRIERNGAGYFAFVNKGSKKAMDVSGAASYNGANVAQWEQNGTGAQRWAIFNASGYADGYICLRNQCGKFLDVSGGNSKKGTNIQIWEGNGTKAQVFKLVPYVQTSYTVVKLGDFSTIEQWKKQMQFAEQKAVGFAKLVYNPDGNLTNCGKMIIGKEVLEYKTLLLPHYLGNGKTMKVKLPCKVRFKLHKHEITQMVWFDFTNLSLTQRCTCGLRSQFQWEVPYPDSLSQFFKEE